MVAFVFDEGVFDLEFVFGINTGETVDFANMSFGRNALVFVA